MENTLYYGDNLNVLRTHIPDNSIDLIYLDPPFNSKTYYNILFAEPAGEPSKAQITAFEDTWHWTEETERTFQEIVDTAPTSVVEMMKAFRQFIKPNDVMAYLTMMCIRLLELKRVLKNTGSIYLHCDPTASHYLKILMDTIFGKKNFRNEVIWWYETGGIPKKDFSRKHDIIFRYSKSDKYIFRPKEVMEKRSDEVLRRIATGSLTATRSTGQHRHPSDVWKIPTINAMAKERLGYPTQKPEALLEKIIKASSNKGDIVLDPFCGCGTANAVAQKLNRKWLGIDITHLAINLIKWRLKDMFGLKPKKDYKVIGEPEDLSGAMELASQNRYQFQWWALSLISARPYGDKKKGADTGIDGYIFFMDDKKEVKKAIVSVKSGKVSVKDIRELGQVIKRESAVLGILLTLEDPTTPMIREATTEGFYKSNLTKKNYPKIQIYTIKDILDAKRVNIPIQFSISPYKQAQGVKPVSEVLEF
ncbi:MAG: restriction endonuclease [Nitrospirae bacterium]|nr:restriction endonuclease [Nitrospirota bacterium]